jgi:hypothetical protein
VVQTFAKIPGQVIIAAMHACYSVAEYNDLALYKWLKDVFQSKVNHYETLTSPFLDFLFAMCVGCTDHNIPSHSCSVFVNAMLRR